MKTKIEKPVELKEFKTRRHHQRGNGLVFGIFLVLTGALLLLNNLGIIPYLIWNYIVGFWPIFLIIAGLKAMFGNSLVSRIFIGIISIVLFGLIIIYGLYEVGSPLVNNLSPDIINLIKNFEIIKR